VPGRAQRRRHPRPARRRRHQSHLLHPRLDRRTLPARRARIVDNGHELASHGYGHQRASDLTPAEFRDDITRAKSLLEDLGGVVIRGYRAPSFSISEKNWWAVEELENAGYVYSSSIYPVKHDHYGMPDAPRFANRPNGATGILELPPTTVPLMGRNLPAAGGGWFRLLPYELSRWMLRRVNTQDQAPCMFYFHPWELDPGQPRQHGYFRQDALPPLRQFATNARQTATIAERF
jgi:polysaccharide deacetylase family protein (PEP-CTERM system associated)